MYKIYGSGREFLEENAAILAKSPLETVFFEVNAKLIDETSNNDFLIKLQDDNSFLLAVHHADYPMVIFGDNGLCAELADLACDMNLTFDKVIGALDTCEAFLAEYEKSIDCTHEINHSMDIMRCDKVLTSNVEGVETPTIKDIDELTKLIVDFTFEALCDNADAQMVRNDIENRLSSFFVIRQDDRIVSMASIKRETDRLACIADVYTLPQGRGKGLSCRIVTKMTRKIIESGRIAYLFVDKANPISNHLYKKIGYYYAVPQYEIRITRKV